MQQLQRILLIAVLFLAVAAVSKSLASAATETIPVWLGSGVTFSALLISARWWWPATLAGAALAAAAWGVAAHGLGPLGAVAFAGVEVSSVAVGAWIATLGGRDPDSPAGAALFIIGALAGSVLGGALAVALWQWQRPDLNLLLEGGTWTLSTAVGTLLLTPVVTAFRGFRLRRSGGMPMNQFLGGAAAFAVFLVAVALVFIDHGQQRYGHVAATLAYLPMPFLLITAALWGPRGGALALLAGGLLIIGRTAAGGGPFAVDEGFHGEAVIEVQGFVTIWAAVMIAVRALSGERRQARDDAQAWRLRYERIMQAVGVASVEYDAVTGHATWSEGADRVLGADAAAIASLDEWLERIDPAERDLVQATWLQVAQGGARASEQSYTLRLEGGRSVRVRERLAGIRGADDAVEQVVGLLRLDNGDG
ncbi:MASE1 domain-containing protein [Chromobacterium sp. CV08]|uniref:MASE1 domain-containing protein n=1 Tax=Chromobacterium sp. CV08 TaxID=3133274 RepID=UPI003DA826C5